VIALSLSTGVATTYKHRLFIIVLKLQATRKRKRRKEEREERHKIEG
jgi:hypothetical protein